VTSETQPGMRLSAIPGIPMIHPGDDLAAIIIEQLAANGEQLIEGDILVLAQKIVSKAEGRLVRVADVVPSEESIRVAEITGREPAVTHVVLGESNEIVRMKRGLLVVEQRNGWVCANAGVDRSNIEPDTNSDVLALLPLDADASAHALRERFAELSGVAPAVLIIDSHGRAWRAGTVGVAIGCAGMPPIWDQRGLDDLFGYTLQASEECIADELAAAASLIMGQSSEGRPAVLIRGYALPNAPHAPATAIQRPKNMDAFR
jgi:coenzyme F420-0:L-glutamate ligase/coenzyme F420-1:gamma-L-glutamate ligase